MSSIKSAKRSGDSRKGFTNIGLIAILVIMGLCITILAPRFNSLAYDLKRSMDIYSARSIASAIDATMNSDRPSKPQNVDELVLSGGMIWKVYPYVPGAVDFLIIWDDIGKFSIIEVDAAGKQIGDPLYSIK